jgi:hypothetical protein
VSVPLPSADDVSPAAFKYANALKDGFLARHPSLDPRTAKFRDEYRYLFWKQGPSEPLASCGDEVRKFMGGAAP